MELGSWRSQPEPGVEEAELGNSWRKADSFFITESKALWISSRAYGIGLISKRKRCLSSTWIYSRSPYGWGDA